MTGLASGKQEMVLETSNNVQCCGWRGKCGAKIAGVEEVRRQARGRVSKRRVQRRAAIREGKSEARVGEPGKAD